MDKAGGGLDRAMGRDDGQWPCLRLAWSRGRATAARARLGEEDRVGYAAGVRAGRRARRCSSDMWRQGTRRNIGLTENSRLKHVLLCLTKFSDVFLQKYELWMKKCKHKKCSRYLGLQILYRKVFLIRTRSRRESGLKLRFQSVSVKRGFLLIFISSFLQILPYKFKICQKQICLVFNDLPLCLG